MIDLSSAFKFTAEYELGSGFGPRAEKLDLE